MKPFLILIAGLLPLGGLTAHSLWLLMTGASDARGSDGAAAVAVDPNASKSAASSALAECGATQEVLGQLENIDLYDVRSLPALTAQAPDSFSQVVAAWTPIHNVGDAWTELSQIYPKPKDDKAEKDEKALKTENEALQNYLKSPAFKGLTNADELSDVLQARIDEIANVLDSRVALVQAQKLFEDRNYSDCLKRLDAIRIEALPASDRSQPEMLRKRAKFRGHWARHESQGEATARTRAELQRLVEESPEPATSDDREFLERKQNDLQAIDAKLRLADLFNADKSPLTLDGLLDGGDKLLADHPSTADEVQRKFREWLVKQFPKRKRLDFDPLLQEAWTKGGLYKSGVFQTGNQPDAPAVWFKYWETPAGYRTKKPFLQIYLSELEAAPAGMTEVRLLDEYEAGRAALLKKVHSRTSWDTFSKLCESLQEEADKYYARRGPGVEPAIAFRQAGEVAAKVRDRWDIAGRMLKSP
jgi:hypothetical protein